MAEGLAGNFWARDIRGTLGIHEVGQYLQIWQAIANTLLNDEPDRLRWMWTADGVYTAESCYMAMFHGSKLSEAWKLTWKTWAPPRVKFFYWLADQDRCWTGERLRLHRLPHNARCLLCDQLPETIHHLIVACPFARQVWHDIATWLRFTCRPPEGDTTLFEWWQAAKQRTPKPMIKGLSSATLLVPWMIWKHRNDCVFNHAQPSVGIVVAAIKEEAFLWVRAGAKGLGSIVPMSWDVH